jgi:oligopeptidase A
MTNPLLVKADHDGRPAYDRILPEHAEPAVTAVLAENRARLESVLASLASGGPAVSWETLVEPLDDMAERLTRAWGPVSHLFGVLSTAEWRAAYGACLPKVTDYHLELSQNEALFEAYKTLAASAAATAFTPAKKKILADALRDFRLSGVGLDTDRRARFRAVALRLSELQAKFQENVLDAVQGWSKQVVDIGELAGMTTQGLAAARQATMQLSPTPTAVRSVGRSTRRTRRARPTKGRSRASSTTGRSWSKFWSSGKSRPSFSAFWTTPGSRSRRRWRSPRARWSAFSST